jgi:hypothetical protein
VATSKIGESDLVNRDGMWFLYATVEVPEPESIDPDGFLGVDRGIANIAYDCDGTRYAGDRLNGYRRRQLRLRKRLQKKNTKSVAAAGPTQQEGIAARRERQPPHRQDHRDRGCTHRPRHRRRRVDGDPRPGPAPQAPTGHTLLVVVPPAWQLPVLQGQFGQAYRWSRSTRSTPPRPATAAVTATNGTGPTRKPSTVGRAGSLPTPITMRPSTSPSGVEGWGAVNRPHAASPRSQRGV